MSTYENPKETESNNLIMNKEEEDLLLNHEYDGIEEFDYPLPSWWVATFIGGVVFAVFYIYFYLVADAPTLKDEFKAEMARIEKIREEARQNTGVFDLENFQAWTKKEGSMEQAKVVYEENCLSCHEAGGKGDIGPNLTDAYWKNLDKVSPEKIYSFILVGNEDNGMPAWQDMLSKEELFAATQYVLSVRNTNVSGGKEPEGEKILD